MNGWLLDLNFHPFLLEPRPPLFSACASELPFPLPLPLPLPEDPLVVLLISVISKPIIIRKQQGNNNS